MASTLAGTLNIPDEHNCECPAIRFKSKLNAIELIDTLAHLLILLDVSAYIRSDNGPELITQAVQDWIAAVGAKTAFSEPGSPREVGHCESFNARLWDGLLNGEVFYSLREAQILIEKWRKLNNTKRPHSALSSRRQAPETNVTMEGPVTHLHSYVTTQVGMITSQLHRPNPLCAF